MGLRRLILGMTMALIACASWAGTWDIGASEKMLHFSWPAAGNVEIAELPLHTGPTPEEGPKVIWSGAGTAAEVGRLDGARDRLYSRFQLAEAGSHRVLGEARCVTDFSRLTQRVPSPAPAAGKKGLTCILDMKDAVRLGMQQANENIDIGGLIDWQSAEPKLSFEFEGRKIGLRPAAVAALDRHLNEAHAAGMRVTGILLNNVPKTAPRNSPLVHPLCDPAEVPIGPAAFNTATAEGLLYYRAIVHWLITRYTRDDAQFGRLGGLVIGNEVQSHWSWYHLGLVEPEVLVREYYVALRVADLVSRSLAVKFPIYLSLEHHWTMPAADDQRRGFSGAEVIEGIAARGRAEGDFPWNVAFHPYPENLGEPRFWNDQSAPLRFDAPRITFHNLEVLPAFLHQPQFLYEGHSRRIALTEQGFHCPQSPDGELAQAAAFALAWKKVQALPEIESFLYHRHVDHPHENGLRCGVREHDGSPNVLGIGRKRKLWEVMQKAGTDEEDDAFAFALEVIGRADWHDVVAKTFAPPRPSHREPGRIVYDFVEHLAEATKENLQAVEMKRIGPPDEVQRRGLLEHPRPKGFGKLTYRVRVPDAAEGGSCLLVFDALLNHPQSRGAAFGVAIGGKELFSRKLSGGECVESEVDLGPWRGQEVAVELVVDALADPAYDWATWVEPRVVVRK